MRSWSDPWSQVSSKYGWNGESSVFTPPCKASLTKIGDETLARSHHTNTSWVPGHETQSKMKRKLRSHHWQKDAPNAYFFVLQNDTEVYHQVQVGPQLQNYNQLLKKTQNCRRRRPSVCPSLCGTQASKDWIQLSPAGVGKPTTAGRVGEMPGSERRKLLVCRRPAALA